MAGRKTKLTKELQERVIALLRSGNTRRVAALASGITEQTFYNWLADGEKTGKGEFFEFFESVKRAEGEAELLMVNSIRKAAQGYVTKSTRTKTQSHVELLTDSSGKPVAGLDGEPINKHVTETEVVTVEGFEFDPRMALEWLKRRNRGDWGDNVRIDVDEEIAGLLALVASGGKAPPAG